MLFLLGSFVILLPIGDSISLVSNVMGEKSSEDFLKTTDYSQRYEKFYKDESFRENYYNYHKQSHNQGQHQKDVTTELKHTSQEQQQFMSSISGETMYPQQKINLQQLLTPRK